MPQRKKAVTSLKGNHGAARLATVTPLYPELDATPPEYLDVYARHYYEEFFPLLTKSGALKQTDREVFISFCVQASIVRQAIEQLKQGLYLKDQKGKTYTNPAEKDFRYAVKSLISIAVELGMSPKARSSIAISKTDEIKADDKLSQLLNLTDGEA